LTAARIPPLLRVCSAQLVAVPKARANDEDADLLLFAVGRLLEDMATAVSREVDDAATMRVQSVSVGSGEGEARRRWREAGERGGKREREENALYTRDELAQLVRRPSSLEAAPPKLHCQRQCVREERQEQGRTGAS
jgi:hypothetical protein